MSAGRRITVTEYKEKRGEQGVGEGSWAVELVAIFVGAYQSTSVDA